MNFRIILTSSLLATLFLNSGCGSDLGSDGSGSEVAASTAAGAANSTEGAVALLNSGPNIKKKLYSNLTDQFSFLTTAWGATCASVVSGSACSGTTLTYALGTSGSGCTFGAGSATWSGNLIFHWTSGSCATPPQSSSALAVFTRTTDSAGISRTTDGKSITTTTLDSSGYSDAKTGGMTITCGNSGCLTGKSITINGIHHVGSSGNLSKWDHTVSTDTPIVMTGTGASRTISSMSVRVQHNLAKMTSVTTVSTPLTHKAGCCFPTGGSIATTYSGGTFDGKSETMTFLETCGQATLTPTGKTASTITLTHCL